MESNDKYKILYVDDSQTNLFLFAETFENYYQIFTALSGEEGLEIVKNNNLDLIISDQAMPKMTGVEFLEKVIEINPGPNRILLTAYSDIRALAEAVNKGKIYQYIKKPWKKNEIKSIIDKSINDYDLRKKNKDLADKLRFHTKKLRQAINTKNLVLTELEKSKDELERSERRLRKMIDLSPVPIIITDLDENILLLNDQFKKVFGYDINDIPTVQAWYPLAYPNKVYREKYIRDWMDRIQNISVTNLPMIPFESIIRCKNGEEKVIRLQASQIEDNIIIMLDDITELRNLKEDISYRIKMENELLKAKKVAESANKSKSEFIASMSHEIRTPMNAILGFAEVLGHELADSVQLDYVNSIQASGKTLLNLINDVLDFSKIEAGKLELRYEPVNIRVIIEEISDLFKFRRNQNDIEFITDVDSNISYFFILDELRIKQILLNLVSNALKFTEKGFVKISVKVLKLRENNARLRISIEDSGIGIAEEQLQKVFDVFEQTEGQDNKKYGGTGLGLSITSKLVNLMGGTISLESIVNQGSKFSIIFNDIKITKDQVFDVESQLVKREKVKFEKSNILVVDDIEDNRKIINLFLQQHNFNIIEAANGYEAIECIRQQKPDLIFMDLSMPEMDGYQAFNLIKENTDWAGIPVVAVTAKTLDNDKQEVLKKGFSDFVSKPIDFIKLERILKQYIKHDVKCSESAEKDAEKIEISGELLNKLPELVKEINEKIWPLIKQLEKIRAKKVVNDLAELLVDFGKKYSNIKLKKFGDDLKLAIKSFNVEKERILISQVRNFLLQLEKIK